MFEWPHVSLTATNVAEGVQQTPNLKAFLETGSQPNNHDNAMSVYASPHRHIW